MSSSKMLSTRQAGVRNISVRKLFGRLDYEVEAIDVVDPDLRRVLILYGENGSGKTTILRLLYDLLSSHPSSGHRGRVGGVPFERFVVTFQDGRQVGASRENYDRLVGPFEFWVADSDGDVRTCTWDRDRTRRLREMFSGMPQEAWREDARLYFADDRVARLADEAQIEENRFDAVVERLGEVVPEAIYHLGDDRSLESDRLPEDEDPNELSPRELHRRMRQPPEDLRTVALQKSLERAHRWINESALGASNIGGQSTNQIYVDVARRIASPASNLEHSPPMSIQQLRDRIEQLGERNATFTALGLLPPAPAAELVQILNAAEPQSSQALLSVLAPYADALAARLDALEHVQNSLATFLDQASAFLSAKQIRFSLSGGFTIATELTESLEPSKLSSGEKQLLLLLTSTLYTRDEPALFIIDEPELSLNAKWQRQLVDSLITCTLGSSTSFVMASHSFELMASARERVATLNRI